jgi:hypothetical protein
MRTNLRPCRCVQSLKKERPMGDLYEI